jgi:hypothetical protein
MDSASKWHMRLNIVGSLSSTTTNVTITVANVVFKDISTYSYQSLYGVLTEAGVANRAIEVCRADGGASTISVASAGNFNRISVSGDVELNAEPTTYTTAANLEGNANVAAYIPSASASTAGLVDTTTQTFEGVKTFKSGLYCDDAAGQSILNYYATESFSGKTITGVVSGTLSGQFARVGNVATMVIDATGNLTANAAGISVADCIPAGYRPPADILMVGTNYVSGAYQTSHFLVASDGTLYIYKTIPGVSWSGETWKFATCTSFTWCLG